MEVLHSITDKEFHVLFFCWGEGGGETMSLQFGLSR